MTDDVKREARHAPLPKICLECEQTLLDAVESRAADWFFCPHAGVLAIAYLNAGVVARWVLSGPTTREHAIEQVKAAAVGRMVMLARTETGGSA